MAILVLVFYRRCKHINKRQIVVSSLMTLLGTIVSTLAAISSGSLLPGHSDSILQLTLCAFLRASVRNTVDQVAQLAIFRGYLHGRTFSRQLSLLFRLCSLTHLWCVLLTGSLLLASIHIHSQTYRCYIVWNHCVWATTVPMLSVAATLGTNYSGMIIYTLTDLSSQ